MEKMQNIKSSLTIIKIVADAIKEAKRIPSGSLYSMLMQHGCTLAQYKSIIDMLKRSELIKEANHELIWAAN